MTWARPDLLALLLVVPLVLLGGVWAERGRRRLLALLAAAELHAGLVGRGVTRARTVQVVLATLAALGLALAAAGPRLGFEWQQQSVEGVSLVVVLDVSRSMDAQDVAPSRLERARREIVDLVGLLRGDAVGLVIFAAGPYVRIPLTVDYDTFLWAVQDSSSDTIRAQGSALAGAITAATGMLEKASGSGKAVVLISDGEGHDPSAELDAALEAARAADVHIYTLGVGDPGGAPIPLPTGGFKKDRAGNVVVSKLDEASLQRLAAATGGAYVRAVASDEDVRAIYVDEIRGKLDAAERGVRREKLWHERFQWPLAVALVAMASSAALGIAGRRRNGALAKAAGLVLAVALLAPGPAYAGAREDGLAALRAQQWAKAAELLGQARVENPGDLSVSQSLAEALYRAGRYREAEQLFQTLAAQDPAHKAVHLYNSGNAAYRGGRLGDALKSFKGAVAADPKLEAAQKNATAVEKEIAARTSPPPPQDSQDQQQQGQSGDDAQSGGQPQAGQQGEQQEGQDGQESQDGQAQASQDGQQGQDGQQQDAQGQQGREGQQNPTQGKQGQQADRQGGGPTDDDQGERQGEADAKATGEPDDQQQGEPGEDGAIGAAGGEQGDTPGAQVDGVGDASGGASNMTPEQAARLVDSIPDGTPRVVVGGAGTEKDW